MKLALIFLSIFVAISHQQYFQPRMMFGFPWMSPFSQQPLAVNDYLNEEGYPGPMGLSSRNDIDQEAEFAGIQSRIKGYSGNFNGLSRYQPISPSFSNQQNARFFFNWANTGNNANNNNNNNNFNPFFKTATFTLTSTVTVAVIQSCAPSNNFLNGAATPCRRKRSESDDLSEEDQFLITPSKTLNVVPTALSTPQDRSLDVLSSSRDDVSDELSRADSNLLREKRFFYGNKNLFVVSTTLTTYAFVNTFVTVTVNLIPPAAFGAANPPVCALVPAVDTPACVACLPTGFIVCPAAAG